MEGFGHLEELESHFTSTHQLEALTMLRVLLVLLLSTATATIVPPPAQNLSVYVGARCGVCVYASC